MWVMNFVMTLVKLWPCIGKGHAGNPCLTVNTKSKLHSIVSHFEKWTLTMRLLMRATAGENQIQMMVHLSREAAGAQSQAHRSHARGHLSKSQHNILVLSKLHSQCFGLVNIFHWLIWPPWLLTESLPKSAPALPLLLGSRCFQPQQHVAKINERVWTGDESCSWRLSLSW